MSVLSCLALLVTLSYCHSAPDCQHVRIHQDNQKFFHGEYNTEQISVTFSARVESNDILSFVSVTLLEEDKHLTTSLSFPSTNDRRIPFMDTHIIMAASKLLRNVGCDVTPKMSAIYEAFADGLYKCIQTESPSQLHFSVMYHVSVVGVAERKCQGKDDVELCTVPKSYEFGMELFLCEEDIQELFEGAKEEANKMKTQVTRFRRSKWWNPFGWGLQGGDTCCCGNYEGCCWYADLICCVHDIICECCDHWFCGPQCKKEPSCYESSGMFEPYN